MMTVSQFYEILFIGTAWRRLAEIGCARRGVPGTTYGFLLLPSCFHLPSRMELITVTALLISRCIARGS
jgi:hypothetical protein